MHVSGGALYPCALSTVPLSDFLIPANVFTPDTWELSLASPFPSPPISLQGLWILSPKYTSGSSPCPFSSWKSHHCFSQNLESLTHLRASGFARIPSVPPTVVFSACAPALPAFLFFQAFPLTFTILPACSGEVVGRRTYLYIGTA